MEDSEDHHHHHGSGDHIDDDLVHEAILEEQKRIVESLQAMQNGEKPLPSGVAAKPVFLGEDRTLYNLYYEPLPKVSQKQKY